PSGTGAGGTEVRSAVLLAAAHDRRCDRARAGRPGGCTGPRLRGHQVADRLADCWRRGRYRLRPLERARPGLADGAKREPRGQLRNAMIAGVDQVPPRLVAERLEPGEDLGAVAAEPGGCQAANVLHQHRARADLLGQAQSLGEQVPVVAGPELLAG